MARALASLVVIGRAGIVAALALAIAGCGSGGGDSEAPPTGPPGTTEITPRYALAPTRRCLVERGARVAALRSNDPRLKALGDLAQRTSLAVRLDGRTVGVAVGDVALLVDLLRVPGDPFTLDVHGNALLMYRPEARAQADIVRDCLRPVASGG
jgi:hypothetical protein